MGEFFRHVKAPTVANYSETAHLIPFTVPIDKLLLPAPHLHTAVLDVTNTCYFMVVYTQTYYLSAQEVTF